MKKIVILLACLFAITITSCNNGKLKQAETQNQELNDSLKSAQAAEAELESVLNEIDSGMNQIKSLEGIINTTNFNQESVSQKDKIKNDMMQIAQLLQERRERVSALEAKLKSSGKMTAANQQKIDEAKAKIDEQAQEILSLKDELAKANVKIDDLNKQVTNLNTTVQTVTSEKQAAQEESTRLANELNTCYYAIGSNKELKEHNIISKKFLGKTKVMEGADFALSYFTKADKRTLNTIPLHSKKAKVWTSQPKDSYEITEDAQGIKTLNIINPTKFWEKSNFLVVQIN